MSFQLTEGNYFGNLIKHKEYPFFHCNITRYEPEARINEHFHENNYLSLLIKGSYLEKHKENTNQIGPGKIIFRPSGYTHANYFDEKGGACLNIEFKSHFYELFDRPVKLPRQVQLFNTGYFSSPYKLLINFMNYMNEAFCEELIFDLLTELSGQPAALTSLPWINKIKSILDSENGGHETLHSLAKKIFVHPVYMARAFKEKTGYTIGEYQLKLKLQRSLKLLFNSRMPINEIAFHSGFYDSAHFVNAFKLIYHISPARFRTGLES